MNLPEFSIKKPVAMSMIFLGIILVGYIALIQLPVELMPNYSYDTISIIIRIRGGVPSPDVERLVTKPVEEAISDVSKLKELIAISEEGESRVILRFEPGTDMDFASLEVREKFGRVKDSLPNEIEKPVIARYQQTDVPMVILAVTGERYTPEMLRRIVDEKIKSRLQRIGGVANIEIAGGRERKIIVEATENSLQSYNISLGELIDAVGANNLDLLLGEVEEVKVKNLIRLMGQYKSIEDIKDIGISMNPQGSIIRLKDVARIKDSFLDPMDISRVDSRPVVSIYIQKESTANTIKVDKMLVEELSKIREELPEDVIIKPTFQQAEYVQEAIDTVRKSLMFGGALAVVVLLLFLHDVAPTFIIALSIPLSVMATFTIMFMQGLTLNVMTLSGLALGIGMLVDSSIVVLENIFKKREQGLKKREAALKGSQEVSLAIAASTITSVVAFLPIMFVGKQIRLLYSGLTWTVVYSLLASLFVALSLIPLASSIIKMGGGVSFLKKGKKNIKKVREAYIGSLKFILKFRYLLILVMIATVVWVWPLQEHIGREFIGITEQNKFTVHVELPTGAKLEMSDKAVAMVEKILKDVPEVRTVSSRIERWSSKVYVKLKPLDQRDKLTNDLIEELRPQMDETMKNFDAFIYFQLPQEVGSNEIFIDINGYDYDVLKQIAMKMAQSLSQVEGITDQKIRMREGRPEIRIIVDQDKLSMFGLTIKDISYQLHGKIRGLRSSFFHTENKEVEIVARISELDRDSFDDLKNITFVNKEKVEVPLKQVADLKFDIAPSEIWHKNKSRMVQVSANRGSLDLNKAIERCKEALDTFEMPENYTYRFSGDYELMVENERQQKFAVITALFLIFLVLASLFESYTQPFIIMATVPLAAIGVIPTLYYTDTSINIGALMGMLMLGGIVVNNAIVMVDHINFLRGQGVELKKAILGGAEHRLRPIFMTSITTICSLMPMALDKSESSNLWSPLAKTVIGGMSVSTVLTLLVIPSGYMILEDLKYRLNRMSVFLKIKHE
ncbi:MAG: efflux RND transporter permease subunit [Candidatus Kaelpia aquatica]|nr:efflux RND transporter permease subunit [Candidatus Kaelpia aquatica]